MEMTANPITKLTRQLFNHFVIYPDLENLSTFQRFGDLIRYHDENLNEGGDISIAANKMNWHSFGRRFEMQLRFESEQLLPDEESMEDLVEESRQWIFPLESVKSLRKERYALHLQRAPIISFVLHSIMQQGKNYGHHSMPGAFNSERTPTLCLYIHEHLSNALTGNITELQKFRAQKLFEIVRRLVRYANWELVEQGQLTDDTLVVPIACNNLSRRCATKNKQPRLMCGPVLEPITKSASKLSTASYISLRSNDMMALHPHELHDSIKERIGYAAVIFDLFEVRHSKSVSVVRSSVGSSKGANFVLYNSARLEALVNKFNERVAMHTYYPLPPLENVDLSLLEAEHDWQLIYGYLLVFPELVESTLIDLQQGRCAVHLLLRYIGKLAMAFSRYYRYKHIIMTPNYITMPTIYARMYLVKAVRQVLNTSLALLGIEPVDYM